MVNDGLKIVARRGVLDLVPTNFLGFKNTSLYVKLDGIRPFSTSLRLSARKSKLNATDIAQRRMTLKM